MNETQIYSAIMFFAGVALTHAVFYFDKINKEKKFFILLSSTILQVLDNIHLINKSTLEFIKEQLKTLDESKAEEYLEKEKDKLLIFMEVYVLLLIKAVPQQGRKYINYRSWSEAKSLIEELRGFTENEQSKSGTLED